MLMIQCQGIFFDENLHFMKGYDVLLIILLGSFPYGINRSYLIRSYFDTNQFLIFSIFLAVLSYFSFKAIHLFLTTYNEYSFFKTSINLEVNDVLTGFFWGIVIYQYYELNKILLLIWLLIGLMIFMIGFTAGAAIHKKKGIRLTKKGKWVKWSEIDNLYFNEVFFGFEINEVRQYPVLASKVKKKDFDDLRNGILKVAEAEIISLKPIPEKSILILGEAELEENGDALDDFIAKIKNFILIEPKGLLFSERNQLISWSNIINIKKEETIIEIKYNPTNPIVKKLYSDDFNTADWQKLRDVLSF